MDPSSSAMLDGIPAGCKVAVLSMRGSCCPVTLAHVQAFVEARALLLGSGSTARPRRLETFAAVLGVLSLNSDSHVSSKLRAKGERFISMEDRAHLVELATAELPWLMYGPTGSQDAVAALRARWPGLELIQFSLNGADDVVTYRKWAGSGPHHRFVTMGRPGYTQRLLSGLRKAKIDPDDGYCIVGPELPDISATAVRKALYNNDEDALNSLLHPAVAHWCQSRGPYRPRALARQTQQRAAALSPASAALHDVLRDEEGRWSAGSDGGQRACDGEVESALHSEGS